MKRLLWTIAALIVAGPAYAQSQLLLGAGKPTTAAPADCSAFLPANFSTSALYISWTTQAPDTSWGMACLSGTTPVAANTLGTFPTGSPTSAGLTGRFLFSNVSWLTQGAGTIYTEGQTTTNAATQYFFDVSDGTLSDYAALRTQANAAFRGDAYAASIVSNFTPTANVAFKSALSYASGAQTIVVNGGAAATGTAATGSALFTASRIGSSPTNTLARSGSTATVAFFSTALSAGTLQTLTTP